MSRRGALLLEVMLSIALFVAAASFCLVATRSLFSALDRAERRQFVIDLARSKMTELDAGLISIQSLRGEWSGAVGSRPREESLEDEPGNARRLEIDVTTSRTEFQGLSLIELTVTEIPDDGSVVDESNTISFTLRQLVALREADADAYELDDLLEGLPDPAEIEP